MLSFELSAIDLILGLSVILLLIFYLTKLSGNSKVKSLTKIKNKVKDANPIPIRKKESTTCPRGFGEIKKFNEDNSVSERCLSCHLILECFSETKKETKEFPIPNV